jgi:S-layer protein
LNCSLELHCPLAAGGGSSSTTTTTATTDTTTATATSQSLALTTGVDAIVGGSGADTISGTSGGTAPTILAGDSVDGGAGADTMLISSSGTTTVTAGLTLSNVETVRVVDTATTSSTVNLAGSTGVETLETFASTGASLSFTNVAAIADLSLNNTAGAAATTVTYASGVTTGTQTQNIALNGANATGNTTIAGVETVAVTSSADSTLVLVASSATDVTVSAGATDNTIDLDSASNTALTTVTAAGSTGDQTILVDYDLGALALSVTGGDGDDVFDISSGALGTGDVLDGGAGSDTILVQSSAATYGTASMAAAAATISNVEVLELEADHSGVANTAFTIDMDVMDGVTSIVLDSNDTDGVNVFNLDDLSAAQTGAISVQGVAGSSNGQTVNLDMKDGSGTADAAVITASLASGNTLRIGDDNGNIESLTLTVSGANASTINIDAGDFAGTTTVDGSLTVSGGAAGKNMTFSTALSSDTVDMSGVVGKVVATLATGVDHTFTGGSGDDTISMTTGLNASDTLDGGAGTDILSLTQTTTVGTAVSVSNFETLRLGGTGTSTINMAGVTGLDTIDLEVTASNSGTNTLQSLVGISTITIDADDNTAADNDYQALTITNGYTGTADALAITINSDATNGMNGTEGLITANGVETLTISATGGEAVQFGGFTSNTMTGITVTANSDFVAADTMALGTLTGGTRTIATYDSSGADIAVTATVASLGNNATVTLGDGADVFSAGSSGGTGIVITAGAGNDSITGSAQADVIYGGAGNDTIISGGGADTLYGDAGNDTITGADTVAETLVGGAGNDTLDGDGGLDTMTGGTGSDTFKLMDNVDAAAADLVTITDFAAGVGGDVLMYDESDLAGGIITGHSATATSVSIGAITAHTAVDNSVVVITGGSGYATDNAAITALAAVDADAVDVLIVYYNTASGYAHVVAHDVVTGTANDVHVASLTNITTVAGMADFVAGNFDAV